MRTHMSTDAALIRPPAPGRDVCSICRDWKNDTAPFCDNCQHNTRQLATPPAPLQTLTLYHRNSHIRDTLTGYKDPACPQRQTHQLDIGRLLQQLIAEYDAQASRPDGICVVPSTRNDDLHPLHHIATQVLPQHRLTCPLRRGPVTTRHRQPHRNGYTATTQLDGQQILLIDDVYTTGARSQSAAHALTRAGADVDRIAVIGRRINPDATPELADWSRRHHLVT